MSLLDGMNLGIMERMMVPCTMMDKNTRDRPAGQFTPEVYYTKGAGFLALLEKTESPEIQVAERQGLREQYLVIVPRGVTLKHDDVFRREADGLTFRITTPTVDAEAPEASTVPIAKCRAERWDIP